MSTQWVEIIEPRTKEHMFANLSTGECVWEPPVGVPVKKTDEAQWWELFDQNTSRFYYYNATSQKTVWHRPANCDIIPLAKLQTLKQNTEPRPELRPGAKEARSEAKRASRDEAAQTSAASKLSRLASGGRRSTGGRVYSAAGAQTSPSASPRSHPRSKHARCRAHTTSGAQRPGHKGEDSEASLASELSAASSRYNGGVKRSSTGGAVTSHNGGHPSDRRSLEAVRHSVNNNGSLSSVNSVKYYASPVRPEQTNSLAKSSSGRYSSPVTAPGLAPPPGYSGQGVSRQRSLEGEQWRAAQGDQASLARSISFMTRAAELNGDTEAGSGGRRSVESTPQSGRRSGGHHPHPGHTSHRSPPEADPRSRGPGHSRTGSVSSMGPGHGAVDGFPTPMTSRRPGKQRAVSESEDSAGPGPSPGKETQPRRDRGQRPHTLIADLVDSGLSTLTDPDSHRSSLNHRDVSASLGQPSSSHRVSSQMKERSLTSLSLQVKKPKVRPHRTQGGKEMDKSPSLQKISPLQHYILEQAKLSGYRFGDKLPSDKRDSYIDSENESHRTGDDSDAFADDEAPSSDGMEERDDISLISTVSSVGEEDSYLAEPTYNNLDPVWAQRHGFTETGSSHLDIDAFSEEFDLRMRWDRGRGGGSTCSTLPRPPQGSSGPAPRPGSAVGPPHSQVDSGHHRHSDLMNTSQLSDKTGSTLSVSASIHSTLSAGTLTDFENFAASNLNIQKKGLFRKKMSLKDVLSWQEESISKPLTFVNEKSQKKEAVAVFKLVQIYMSDRKAKVGMTINSVAQEISDNGYGSPGLRDEVYIQLCKQVSDNPRRESLRRGWELLAICLAFFPPSPTFFPYLLGFIQKHRDPNMDFPEVGRWPLHVQISHYAGICNKRLERIGIGGRLGPKKPTLEDIDQSRLQIFRPSMFGGTLQETLNIQKDKFPSRRLPWILTTLTEQIMAMNGLGTEGIFRIPADFDEVMSVKCRYDQWEPGTCSDAHVPAALLKQWLRELYIPLIPDDNLYAEAIRVGEDAELATILVQKLPELHQIVLSFLIRFLQIFVSPDIVSVTKMDASNLSMVFAPNFLRCPSKDPIVIMENTRKEMAFVKTLIHHLDTSTVEGLSENEGH